MSKTVLFLTIQFCISTQFSFIWPMDRTLSSATTPGLTEPWSNGNIGVLHIPQSSSITGASPSDCLVSCLGHSLRESYSSANLQSMYSEAPADLALLKGIFSNSIFCIKYWIRIFSVSVRLLAHLNDILKKSYLNDISRVTITFCLVYEVWQLVYIIQQFFFSFYKEIYTCKVINFPSVKPYAFIHPAHSKGL